MFSSIDKIMSEHVDKSALTDHWHFPRPDLAQSYLRSFDLGLTSARGLFARRRMGKSEFLKHDLLPAAKHDGYLAAYTNLWDSTDHPGQALRDAILLATQPKGLGKFWTDLNAPNRKLKGGGKLPLGVEGSIELDLAEKGESGGPRNPSCIASADKAKKRLLLVIDEAQVLAAPEHKSIAHALRAGLDIRKAGIKVLFAGSSEAALREMFSRAAAPFYNWAPLGAIPAAGTRICRCHGKTAGHCSKAPLESGRRGEGVCCP